MRLRYHFHRMWTFWLVRSSLSRAIHFTREKGPSHFTMRHLLTFFEYHLSHRRTYVRGVLVSQLDFVSCSISTNFGSISTVLWDYGIIFTVCGPFDSCDPVCLARFILLVRRARVISRWDIFSPSQYFSGRGVSATLRSSFLRRHIYYWEDFGFYK